MNFFSAEIEVVKTATVAELKKSVEAAFSHLPKEGPGKVSWYDYFSFSLFMGFRSGKLCN